MGAQLLGRVQGRVRVMAQQQAGTQVARGPQGEVRRTEGSRALGQVRLHLVQLCCRPVMERAQEEEASGTGRLQSGECAWLALLV